MNTFGSLFVPVPLCVGILFVGLELLWIKRTEKAGRIIVTLHPAAIEKRFLKRLDYSMRRL